MIALDPDWTPGVQKGPNCSSWSEVFHWFLAHPISVHVPVAFQCKMIARKDGTLKMQTQKGHPLCEMSFVFAELFVETLILATTCIFALHFLYVESGSCHGGQHPERKSQSLVLVFGSLALSVPRERERNSFS